MQILPFISDDSEMWNLEEWYTSLLIKTNRLLNVLFDIAFLIKGIPYILSVKIGNVKFGGSSVFSNTNLWIKMNQICNLRFDIAFLVFLHFERLSTLYKSVGDNLFSVRISSDLTFCPFMTLTPKRGDHNKSDILLTSSKHLLVATCSLLGCVTLTLHSYTEDII